MHNPIAPSETKYVVEITDAEGRRRSLLHPRTGETWVFDTYSSAYAVRNVCVDQIARKHRGAKAKVVAR